MSEKKYKVGYCPGVFDLFHIGHLNLIKNCKDRCEYLIVGVLTDELVEHFKNRKTYISFEERYEIVKALALVDEVVPVTLENTVKIDAWNQLHFDCHFSGNDHGADWDEDLRQLREVGSNMEFFQYTMSTSSTRIRKIIEDETMFQYAFKCIENKRVVLFGIGKMFDEYMSQYGVDYRPEFAVDNDESKWGTEKNGIIIKSPKEILDVPNDDLWLIICMADTKNAENQLHEMGIDEYRIFRRNPKIITVGD